MYTYCQTQTGREILVVSFVVDILKSGQICEDFSSSFSRITDIHCCNNSLYYIPCYDGLYLNVSSNCIYLFKNSSVSRLLLHFLTFCKRPVNFTATIMLEFSDTQQGMYIFVLENTCLFFPLHLKLLIEAIDLTAESRIAIVTLIKQYNLHELEVHVQLQLQLRL